MVQSVAPFQAQQYAEITGQLEITGSGYEHGSFHPISPAPGPASQGSTLNEKPLPNPFDEKIASNPRIDSMSPALPPIASLSRTGTPIDPNLQHADWSYDCKAQTERNRLSVTGMPMPEPPICREAVIIREDHPVHSPTPAPNVSAQPAKRPVSMFDADSACGGM
ncbi:hypothetical protein RSAG8_10784, partial [Rhizoctonia solani AG-8 WAC10335]